MTVRKKGKTITRNGEGWPHLQTATEQLNIPRNNNLTNKVMDENIVTPRRKEKALFTKILSY